MSKCFSGSQSYIVLVGDCLWLKWFEQLVNSWSDSSFSPPPPGFAPFPTAIASGGEGTETGESPRGSCACLWYRVQPVVCVSVYNVLTDGENAKWFITACMN